MSSIDEIVSRIPMDQLAARLGVEPGTAESAVRQALPALLGGMHANAADPQGAASLTSALDQHSPDLVAGGVNLDQVDAGQGQQIVDHVFGNNTEQVSQNLAGQLPGGGNDLVKKLLPILAPIVMSYLSERLHGGGGQGGSAGGGLGQILGSVVGELGGGAGGPTGGSILDSLGGLLGGGRR